MKKKLKIYATEIENEEEEKPSYFAVIPAKVRYNKKLPMGAKVLFAELTSLTNLYGYSWARNKYLQNLFQVSKMTVCTWLNLLESEGYIKIEYLNGRGDGRKIWLAERIDNVFDKMNEARANMRKKKMDNFQF